MDWGSTVPHKQWGILPKGFGATGSFTDVRKGVSPIDSKGDDASQIKLV